jgi:DNA-binding CsgD family transcriptional regulator
MGRAIERPFHVLGALAGELLLEQKVSHGVMSLVYMGLLILAVVLLYRLFLLYAEAWKHSAVEETVARVKAETAKLASAVKLAEVSAADNNKDTTAANNAAAVPAENVAYTFFETAAKETEIWEDYSAEARDYFAIEPVEESTVETEKNIANTVTEQKAEVTEATPEKIIIPNSSLTDDSGPLHGDRLRKYQLRYRLTNRETEVLWEILQKHKISEIASNLYITLPTAKYHISNILQKTGSKNQRELRYLIQKEEQ